MDIEGLGFHLGFGLDYRRTIHHPHRQYARRCARRDDSVNFDIALLPYDAARPAAGLDVRFRFHFSYLLRT